MYYLLTLKNNVNYLFRTNNVELVNNIKSIYQMMGVEYTINEIRVEDEYDIRSFIPNPINRKLDLVAFTDDVKFLVENAKRFDIITSQYKQKANQVTPNQKLSEVVPIQEKPFKNIAGQWNDKVLETPESFTGNESCLLSVDDIVPNVSSENFRVCWSENYRQIVILPFSYHSEIFSTISDLSVLYTYPSLTHNEKEKLETLFKVFTFDSKEIALDIITSISKGLKFGEKQRILVRNYFNSMFNLNEESKERIQTEFIEEKLFTELETFGITKDMVKEYMRSLNLKEENEKYYGVEFKELKETKIPYDEKELKIGITKNQIQMMEKLVDKVAKLKSQEEFLASTKEFLNTHLAI